MQFDINFKIFIDKLLFSLLINKIDLKKINYFKL